jgi:hypothetical protein
VLWSCKTAFAVSKSAQTRRRLLHRLSRVGIDRFDKVGGKRAGTIWCVALFAAEDDSYSRRRHSIRLTTFAGAMYP